MKKLILALLLFSCSKEEMNTVSFLVECTAGCDIEHTGGDGEIKATCIESAHPDGGTIINCEPLSKYGHKMGGLSSGQRIFIKAKDKQYTSQKIITVYLNGDIWLTSDQSNFEVSISANIP